MAEGLVGRDEELRLIASFLEQAASDGGALLFTGEPGVGKTALLDAAEGMAAAAGAQIVRVVGSEFGSRVSFAGLGQVLRPLSAETESLSPLHRRALAAALGGAAEAPRDRLVVSQAALVLLRQAAATRPLLLILDDPPWLDQPSGMALRFVARRLMGTRVGFLAAYRPETQSMPEYAGLISRELRPLDDAAAASLLSARFPELAPRIRQRLLAEAQGNPLALLELPALLTGPQRTALAPLPSVLPLGERLTTLFASRVTQLPAQARQLLLLAALDGSGDLHVLQATGNGQIDDLAPAEQAQLVRIDQGTGRLAFRHPLIRSAFVELATEQDRREAHRALAEQLTDQPERRAWHLSEAADGPDEQVAALLEGVAHRVLRRGDAAGAVSSLLRAAELSPARSDRTRRLAGAAWMGASITMETGTVSPLLSDAGHPGPQAGVSLLAAAAAAVMLLNGDGDVVTAHRLLTQAIEDHTGPERTSGAGLLEAISALFIVTALGGRPEFWPSFQAAMSKFAPDLPMELRLASQVHADPARTTSAVLAQIDDAVASLGGETDLVRILTISSAVRFSDRQAGCREALWRVVRELRQGSAVTPLINALEQLSFDAWTTGQWDQAQELADECLQLCLTHGYLLPTWSVRYRQALIAAARGAYDVVDVLLAEITEWAAPRRIGQADAAAHHVRSLVELGRGDFEDAYRHAAAISPAGVLAPHAGYALLVLLDLVEAAVRTGRRAEAAAHVQAIRDAGIAAISPRLALIAAGAGALAAPGDQARSLFEEALAIPETSRWPFDLARVRLLYGQWLRRRRSAAEARVQLSAAMDTFRWLGALPWQVRAGNELRATGKAARDADQGSPGAPGRPAAGLLGPLDRQIAGLAAAGLTNKQIGARLHLSHRTVAAHLYQTFPRLGITSRAALRDALDTLTETESGDLRVRDPAAMKTQGNQDRQVDASHRLAGEILGAEDHQVSRATVGIVHEGHDVAVVFGGLRSSRGEDGLARGGTRAELVRLGGAGGEVMLDQGVSERLVGEVAVRLDGGPALFRDRRRVAVTVWPSYHPVVHTGVFLVPIVQSARHHPAGRRVDAPPLEGDRPVPGEDGHVVGPLIADQVHHYPVTVVVGVECVEDPARVDVDPADGAGIHEGLAAHQTDARLVRRVPGVRHLASAGQQVQAEGDRQVQQDQVVLGQCEVVHHGPVVDRDVGGATHPSRGVDDDVPDVIPGPEVRDSVQLTGPVIGLGVRGEAASQRAAEVARPERVQLIGKLVRQRARLCGGQGPPGMTDDVHVGREVPALIYRAGRPRLVHRRGQPPGSHPAVPVPLGPAVAQPDPVHHARPEEPVIVRVVQAERIRSVAQITAVQLGWHAAGDRQVEGGDLVGGRGESTREETVTSAHGRPDTRMTLMCSSLGAAPARAISQMTTAESDDSCPPRASRRTIVVAHARGLTIT
jgi:DNA-binding CsgD family transcriptional regulator